MNSRSHHRRYRPDACRNHGRCHCGEQRKAERHGDESSAHHRVHLILPGIRRIAHSDLHNACISAQQADQYPAGGIGVPDTGRLDSRDKTQKWGLSHERPHFERSGKLSDYLPSSVSRRDASVGAASATGTAAESEPSRLRISIVPLFTVSRPATAISGTPISSASLNLTPGETFLRSS